MIEKNQHVPLVWSAPSPHVILRDAHKKTCHVQANLGFRDRRVNKQNMAPRPDYCRSNAPSWFRTTPTSYTQPAPPRVVEPVQCSVRRSEPPTALPKPSENINLHPRVRPPPPPAAPRQPAPSPAGKGGEIWQRMYEAALKAQHPMPERMADSMLLSRERALGIKADRHHIERTTAPPKQQEAAATSAPKKARAVLSDACRCKALTLEGRRCGFKATCGDFCSKHKVAQ